MMIVPHQRRRLQAVDQAVGLLQTPVGGGLVPPAVEPDSGDVAIVRQQLAELIVHEVQIAVELAALRTAGAVAGAAARIVVGMMPVELGVIEEQLHSLLAALLGQHLERILLIGSRVDDVPLGLFRTPHGEAVVSRDACR